MYIYMFTFLAKYSHRQNYPASTKSKISLMSEKIIILKLELRYKLNISQALTVSFFYIIFFTFFTMCRFLSANVPNYVITEEKKL